MLGKTDSKPSRVGWIVIHGGLLGCGLWLWMLAEDHREGSRSCPAVLEQSDDRDRKSATSDADNNQAEIEKQIARLRDPIYGVRAKATRQLLVSGSQAVPPLAEALGSQDPDVRRHAQLILAGLIRSDEACFSELEDVACSPDHPSSMAAAGILQRECRRRVDVETAIIEQRKANALRCLREAQDALSQGQFFKARQMVFAAEALHVASQPGDDKSARVLEAIERAEERAAHPPRPTLVTAERESVFE